MQVTFIYKDNMDGPCKQRMFSVSIHFSPALIAYITRIHCCHQYIDINTLLIIAHDLTLTTLVWVSFSLSQCLLLKLLSRSPGSLILLLILFVFVHVHACVMLRDYQSKYIVRLEFDSFPNCQTEVMGFFFKLKTDSSLIQYIQTTLHSFQFCLVPTGSLPLYFLFRNEQAAKRQQPNMTKTR